jgi:hypothetical protein
MGILSSPGHANSHPCCGLQRSIDWNCRKADLNVAFGFRPEDTEAFAEPWSTDVCSSRWKK